MINTVVPQQKVLSGRKRSCAVHVQLSAMPEGSGGTGRCTFMPMTSQLTFRQRHTAARKSYYAMDARHSTFQFQQRAIVQRFQILLCLFARLFGAFLHFSLFLITTEKCSECGAQTQRSRCTFTAAFCLSSKKLLMMFIIFCNVSITLNFILHQCMVFKFYLIINVHLMDISVVISQSLFIMLVFIRL